MIYCFDIDNTICKTEGVGYTNCTPYKERITHINELYDKGNTIYILTARGMGRTKNNQQEAYNELFDYTKKQLDSWNLKYHELFLGKPCADIFVDDRGCSDSDFFSPKV